MLYPVHRAHRSLHSFPTRRSSDLVRSASSIIASAMRSLIDPPGLARSDFIHTSARSPNRRLMRMWGVLPIVSRRSEEHTSELQSPVHLVCRLLLEKKKLEELSQKA